MSDASITRQEEPRPDPEQAIQEEEYAFPYHHVVQNRVGFSQCFSDGWGLNYLATIEFLIDRMRRDELTSVVDIGCGDGRFTRELMRAFPDARVAGVDYSARAIALAEAMVPEGDFRCVDITSAAQSDIFDTGVLMEVFEHVPPPMASRFVDAVAALLRPAGILYVTVPHVNKPVEPKHYRHFSADSLAREFAPWFDVTETVPIERISVRKTVIDFAFENPLFALNNRRIGALLYGYFRKHLFLAESEERCKRVVMKFRRREAAASPYPHI